MRAHSLKSVTLIKSLLKMSHPVTFCEVDAQSVFASAEQPFHEFSATMAWNAKKLDVEVLC